jgi:hypothetical protein
MFERQPFTNCVSSLEHILFPDPLPAQFFKITLTRVHPRIYPSFFHEAMTE